MSEKLLTPIEIGLTAAIVALEGNEPLILTASGGDGDRLAGLPFGPFDAVAHRTFEIGLRAWVEEQAGLRLGYVEQLYTFGDRGRHTEPGDTDAHVVSIGYLALTRAVDNSARAPGATFEPWYRFFPWEDWRQARPEIASTVCCNSVSVNSGGKSSNTTGRYFSLARSRAIAVARIRRWSKRIATPRAGVSLRPRAAGRSSRRASSTRPAS